MTQSRPCFLMEDSTAAVDARRISIAPDTDVVSGIYVMPDCIPAVMPMLAAVPQATTTVTQTRARGDCSSNLLLPVDGSIEPLDDDGPDVLTSGMEPARIVQEVGSDVCVVPDLLPVAVTVKTVVAEVVMEKFVLAPGSGRVRYSASVVSCHSPEVSFRPFLWGRSSWMWSVWALARHISD